MIILAVSRFIVALADAGALVRQDHVDCVARREQDLRVLQMVVWPAWVGDIETVFALRLSIVVITDYKFNFAGHYEHWRCIEPEHMIIQSAEVGPS